MSNVENLRKQAKQILRWHRERHWPVAEQIRSTLPDFVGMTDRQIFDSEFRLSDAQQLVARQSGFEDWPTLKASVQPGPPHGDDATIARLVSVTPMVLVSDIRDSTTWYAEKLGFSIDFEYGDPPFYAQVSCNGLTVALRQVDPPVLKAHQTRRHEEELLCLSFSVEGIKDKYLAMEKSGATMYQKLRTEPWGARSYVVQDPDGNLLAFHSTPGALENDAS